MSTIKAGDKFNKLTAIKFSHKKNRNYYWVFLCDCGKMIITRRDSVISGKSKSCGCSRKEYKNNLKHGMRYTRVYNIWRGIKYRCLNKNCKVYKNYGGRGITICNRWLKFENFYADMGDCPKNKSIDRKNNDKGYSKSNCRWATRKEQANNRRKRKIWYRDKTGKFIH